MSLLAIETRVLLENLGSLLKYPSSLLMSLLKPLPNLFRSLFNLLNLALNLFKPSATQIEVTRYQETWPEDFARIHKVLNRMLRFVKFIRIEHVGSTSVHGLSAKPIIDVDIVVKEEDSGHVINALRFHGYIDRKQHGVKEGRWAFQREDGIVPARNVYVVLDGGIGLRNHLALRDVLRVDAGLRREYGNLKMGLSRSGVDSYSYNGRKTGVVMRILEQSGRFDAEELEYLRKAYTRTDGDWNPLEVPDWL